MQLERLTYSKARDIGEIIKKDAKKKSLKEIGFDEKESKEIIFDDKDDDSYVHNKHYQKANNEYFEKSKSEEGKFIEKGNFFKDKYSQARGGEIARKTLSIDKDDITTKQTPSLSFSGAQREVKDYSGAQKSIEEKSIIEEIKEQLKQYGETHRLKELQDIKGGLNAVGILAVKDTRAIVKQIIKRLKLDSRLIEEVDVLASKLYTGTIWDKADELAWEHPGDALKIWIIVTSAAIDSRKTKKDMSTEEFLKDLERIKGILFEAAVNSRGCFSTARDKLLKQLKEQFVLEDDIPVSKVSSGFLAMAINGYKAGIVKRDGLLFVGSKKLYFDFLIQEGLREEEKESDEQKAVFYVNNMGIDVVKKIDENSAIILNGDEEIAKKLAKTGSEKMEQLIDHDIMYKKHDIYELQKIGEEAGIKLRISDYQNSYNQSVGSFSYEGMDFGITESYGLGGGDYAYFYFNDNSEQNTEPSPGKIRKLKKLEKIFEAKFFQTEFIE